MKKFILFFGTFLISFNCAHGATPWWEQPTVCRLNPSDCYRGMGAGFEPEMWDDDAKCWGMKIICADAMKPSTDKNTPMGRKDIASGKNIVSDFDVNLLSATNECFGRRKTAENGTIASVNGTYVNVWCPGILDNPDEVLDNGEITYGTQPTCKQLAEYGYVAVENGRCYGKYFDTSKYFLDCGTKLTPDYIIVLNGADYQNPSATAPTTQSAADTKFDTMYTVSKSQKSKYFKK
ncbi:MAG: hypothetical protein IKL37_03185 [Alphaproteobacteria bacterium]|nr:hypothetical protein [Alphaproteobacteria bacterium]